jgi:mono/diheme cytochrome c family protein
MTRKIAVLTLLTLTPALARAQAPAKPPIVKKGPAPVTSSSDGQQMFISYCAPCHGRTGKGDGPAAPALTPKPSDLTQMTKKHGGTLSQKDLEDKMNGIAASPAHGSTDMPVWGPMFRQMTGSDQLRIYNLKKYIDTLQAP